MKPIVFLSFVFLSFFVNAQCGNQDFDYPVDYESYCCKYTFDNYYLQLNDPTNPLLWNIVNAGYIKLEYDYRGWKSGSYIMADPRFISGYDSWTICDFKITQDSIKIYGCAGQKMFYKYHFITTNNVYLWNESLFNGRYYYHEISTSLFSCEKTSNKNKDNSHK